MLLGGTGDDTLAGDSGFEISGTDTLTGGAGDDRFECDPFGETATAPVMDTVTDFEGAGDSAGDTLELESFGPAVRFTFGGQLAALPRLGDSIGAGVDGISKPYGN